jgi:hypothetical protein
MQDVYPSIADALARPLRAQNRRALYQLWRADFAALARLALVCKDAAAAVHRLLWTFTALGARERERRAQVEQTRRFLRLPAVAPLIASAEWTHVWRSSNHHVRFRSRVRVAFNGRLRIREHCFPGRRERRLWVANHGCAPESPTLFNVGLTLTGEEQGRLLVVSYTLEPRRRIWSGHFSDHERALGDLRYLTLLGREHWSHIQSSSSDAA